MSEGSTPIGMCELIEVSESGSLAKVSSYFVDEKVRNSKKEPFTLVGKSVIVVRPLTK